MLTDAYLGPFGALTGGPLAARLAHIAMPVHLARIHRDRVLPGLEQPWELDRVVPALMVGLLRTLGGDLPTGS